MYAEMRMEETQTEQPHSYTTARTLLSILRLSQALARLRLDDVVGQVWILYNSPGSVSGPSVPTVTALSTADVLLPAASGKGTFPQGMSCPNCCQPLHIDVTQLNTGGGWTPTARRRSLCCEAGHCTW